MRDNGGAAACGRAAGAAGARDGCALSRFASFLNNAALAHAIGALWPALCPRARWAGPPVWGWSSRFRGWSKQQSDRSRYAAQTGWPDQGRTVLKVRGQARAQAHTAKQAAARG